MNYYLRKASGAPIDGPFSSETIRAMMETECEAVGWQLSGDIGEPRERVEQSPDRATVAGLAEAREDAENLTALLRNATINRNPP
jgi:hypothetical protein